MDTNRFIEMLAAENASTSAPMTRVWWTAGVFAVVSAGMVFFAAMGPRPDFMAAAATPRFLFKFVATGVLAFTAILAVIALARPGAPISAALRLLLLAPALLIMAIAAEVIAVPTDQLQSRWLGTNALLCLTFIPLIGIGPLVAIIVALRQAAPTQPTLSGAVAGLVAGGIAATFYAAHCFDDSPLFVGSWYSLAVLLLVGSGAIAGKLFLKW